MWKMSRLCISNMRQKGANYQTYRDRGSTLHFANCTTKNKKRSLPDTPRGQHKGGSHTTWPAAGQAQRTSQTQSLKKKKNI